mgnify:CR=1 FL=1
MDAVEVDVSGPVVFVLVVLMFLLVFLMFLMFLMFLLFLLFVVVFFDKLKRCLIFLLLFKYIGLVVSVTLIGKFGLLIGFDDQLPVRIFCCCVNEIALGEKEVGTGS